MNSPVAHNRIDLTGKRFGHLVVEGPDRYVNHALRWRCRCDCGGTTSSYSHHLRSGKAKSCGCQRANFVSAAATDHGHARRGGITPEFRAWKAMRERCSNPKCRSYKDYGGRGISVCARWRNFEYFLADMGPRPSKDLSLDRINVDGNYETMNCRWATASQQNKNRRKRK